MKKELRGLCGIALIVLVGTSGISSVVAQQPQSQTEAARGERERAMQDRKASTPSAERDRVLIEREIAAQDAKAATAMPEREFFERQVIMQGPPAGDFIFQAIEMSFGGLLVKGAPYSAQAITESSQTLSDGNRIVNKSTASVYRDSEGRTRREQTLKAIGPFANGGEPAQTIFISDPVAGTSYTLDQRTQTARKMPPLRFKVSGPKSKNLQAGTTQLRMRVDGPNAGETPGEKYQVAIESDAMVDKKQQAEKYRAAIGADVMVLRKQTEAGVAMGWLDERNPSANSEALGKQNIEGVEAEGTRTTVTIPAGKIGNELPISIVSERWYSPELQVIVMTRHTDPRFGENSYKLTNISRTEPARELFEVPAGYTVKEMPAPVGVGVGVGAGVGSTAPIGGGVLNGRAITLPRPEYPAIAKQANASGNVTVQITIDEDGNVISATAVSGHPLLRAAAVSAAREARFSPTRLSGQAVKVSGVVVYNFAAQ